MAFVVLSLAIVLALLVYLFEDRIKQYAVSYLNQYLNTEVKVESIDLNLFSSFPNASLDFSKVLIMDPPGIGRRRDTLLYADKLYLEFSIWDLLSNNYSVKNIELNGADIRLFVDQQGKENYVIWKEGEKKQQDEKFEFNLERVALKKAQLHYIHKKSRQDYALKLNEFVLKGKFSEKVFSMQTRLKGQISHFETKDIRLIQHKNTTLDLSLEVDRNSRIISFNTGNFRLGDMNFGVSGSVKNLEETLCDIHLQGQDIRIESLLKTFPSILGDDLRYYETSGDLKFIADITGPATQPHIKSTFNIKGAELSEKRSGVRLNQLNFIGSYLSAEKGEEDKLLIDDLSGSFGDGTFNGKISLSHLAEPKIIAKLNGDFNLKTLNDFFRFKTVEEASGQLHLSANLNGKFTHLPEEETWKMDVNSASGAAEISAMNMKLREHPVHYNNFSGKFILSNNNAFVEGLQGYMGKTDIAIDGVLQNLLPYLLLKKQKLNIAAEFQSENLDLNDLLAGTTTEANNNESKTDLHFPDDINFNLDASVGKVSYSTFHATKIKGNFKLIDKLFSATQLRLLFAGGNCTGEMEIDGRNNKEFVISSDVNISDMDIRETFVLFRQFGQDVVKEENIKGLLSAKVRFGTLVDSALNIDKNKIICQATLSLKNGELIQLEAFRDIAKYMREDKKIRLALGKNIDDLEKRLHHILFSELSNTIIIKNGMVHIPKMDIASSALTVNLWGEHSFENIIDYHLNFRFIELKAANYETEYGTIIDDKSGFKIYIHMFGDLNQPRFESDSEVRKQERKAYNEAEKQNIKAILKEEFGLFKKDSSLKVRQTPEEEVKFLMEWDEKQTGSGQPVNDKEEKEEKKKDNKERLNKFKKKLGVTETDEKQKLEIEQ